MLCLRNGSAKRSTCAGGRAQNLRLNNVHLLACFARACCWIAWPLSMSIERLKDLYKDSTTKAMLSCNFQGMILSLSVPPWTSLHCGSADWCVKNRQWKQKQTQKAFNVNHCRPERVTHCKLIGFSKAEQKFKLEIWNPQQWLPTFNAKFWSTYLSWGFWFFARFEVSNFAHTSAVFADSCIQIIVTSIHA